MELAQQRQDLRRGSGRASCPRCVASTRNASPCSRQYASVSSRQTAAADGRRRRSRRGAIPVALPRDDEPVEDRLDLVGGGVPGRAQAVARNGVALLAQLRLGQPARRRARRPRRRAPRGRSARPPRTRRRAACGSRAARRRGSRARRSACQRQVESAPPETRQQTSPPGSIRSCGGCALRSVRAARAHCRLRGTGIAPACAAATPARTRRRRASGSSRGARARTASRRGRVVAQLELKNAPTAGWQYASSTAA